MGSHGDVILEDIRKKRKKKIFLKHRCNITPVAHFSPYQSKHFSPGFGISYHLGSLDTWVSRPAPPTHLLQPVLHPCRAHLRTLTYGKARGTFTGTFRQLAHQATYSTLTRTHERRILISTFPILQKRNCDLERLKKTKRSKKVVLRSKKKKCCDFTSMHFLDVTLLSLSSTPSMLPFGHTNA